MFVLYADKAQLTVREKEPITSGSVNVYPVRFEFSPDWDGLEKTAVFQAGCRSWSILLEAGVEYTIPWEALKIPGYCLFAGVYGQQGEEIVLPTIWANLGLIQPGRPPVRRPGRPRPICGSRSWPKRATGWPTPRPGSWGCMPVRMCCPLCRWRAEAAAPPTSSAMG